MAGACAKIAPTRALLRALAVATALYVVVPIVFAGNLYLMSLVVAALTIGGVALAWALLGNLGGLVSFGHAAFFGAGVYTTSVLAGRLGLPFLLTIPLGAIVAAAISVLVGLVVFRSKTLRGEFFALLTLSVTFVLAAIISNSAIDPGTGIFLSGVPIPSS